MILQVNESRRFLRKVAAEVDPTGPSSTSTIAALRAAIAELDTTVTDSRVTGLAANQLGHDAAIFIARLNATPELTVCINPNLVYRYSSDPQLSSERDSTLRVEGCSSSADEFYAVRRHTDVTLTYLDETGIPQIVPLSGLPAAIAQHECDHLEGVLIADIGLKVSPVPAR